MSDRCPVVLPEGGKAAHCTVCHETFTTAANFDRHRRGQAATRVCLDPASVGLVRVQRKGFPAWSMPGREEEVA